jgi:hypothetical protein
MAIAIALICAITFLLGLWLTLSAVRQLRPKTFKIKATITKWASVEVELQSPEPTQRGLPSALVVSSKRQQPHRPQVPEMTWHYPPDLPGPT